MPFESETERANYWHENYKELLKRNEQLEAENKEQAEFLSLAKEQMDAYLQWNHAKKEKIAQLEAEIKLFRAELE